MLELVDLLENKLTRLLLNQGKLKEENRQLKRSEEKLMKRVSEQDLVINNLEDEFQTFKVVSAIVGSKGDKHLTKIKINSLIREIDKCIVQLSD